MPKVFIPNKGAHDYSQAATFGELAFLSEGDIGPFSIGEMYRVLAEGLKDSCPEDLLVITGLGRISALAASMFSYKHGRVNMLLWTGTGYVRSDVVMSNLIQRDGQES